MVHYCEPMVDGNRTPVRILCRYEANDEPGWAWRYTATDRYGNVHDVWRMDDPRPMTAEEALGEP